MSASEQDDRSSTPEEKLSEEGNGEDDDASEMESDYDADLFFDEDDEGFPSSPFGGSSNDVQKKSEEPRVASVPFKASEEMKEPFQGSMVEKGPYSLGTVDSIHLAIVLEQLSDQLDVIGHSIDAPQVDLRSKASVQLDLSVHRPVFTNPATEDPYSSNLYKRKYFLRQHYETVATRRLMKLADDGAKPEERFRRRLGSVLRTYRVSKFCEKGKIQAERTQFNITVDNLVTELIQDSSFTTLQRTLEQEKVKYEGMKKKVDKSIQDQQYIIDTKKAIKSTRKEKKTGLIAMQKVMWGIEDDTQEMRARKELEALYTEKCGLMWKKRIKKICAKNEGMVADEKLNMRKKTKLSGIAHASLMDTLSSRYTEAQKRLEYWMDKYEVDKEDLQSKLDIMKANRARDLERISWLKFTIHNYGQIVRDDRRIKNDMAEKERRFLCEIKKATIIQAWWRGEMVRKRLGPYDPKKQKAQEKDGGKKKKKKKK